MPGNVFECLNLFNQKPVNWLVKSGGLRPHKGWDYKPRAIHYRPQQKVQ